MFSKATYQSYINATAQAAPLAVFRILLGLLMCISIIRFWAKGWIEKLYLEPSFHFKYAGFEWVQVPPDVLCYLLFVICGLSALFVAVGFKYKWSVIIFFLSFTYIELMDKTTYLNHYYFVSVLSFIMIFLPAGGYFSVDARYNPEVCTQYIPRWNIDIIKLMLTIVYVFAGFAKLNYDWLINAMPLTIWLPTKFNLPLLGDIIHEKWLHYAFSWGGAFYDLTIPFFLMWTRTRVPAFITVLVFHLLTRMLFPIGMFPYIMIVATLIFFSPEFHNRVLEFISQIFKFSKAQFDNSRKLLHAQSKRTQAAFRVMALFMIFQIIIPLRFLAYSGDLFWTEQGYRFSWRVMLMEKTGYANFKVVDGQTGKRFYVQNEDFLTAFQQKQMASQVDFIIDYAQYLGQTFESHGHQNVEVYVESYASLNGRRSQPYVDPTRNLYNPDNQTSLTAYILPLHD